MERASVRHARGLGPRRGGWEIAAAKEGRRALATRAKGRRWQGDVPGYLSYIYGRASLVDEKVIKGYAGRALGSPRSELLSGTQSSKADVLVSHAKYLVSRGNAWRHTKAVGRYVGRAGERVVEGRGSKSHPSRSWAFETGWYPESSCSSPLCPSFTKE